MSSIGNIYIYIYFWKYIFNLLIVFLLSLMLLLLLLSRFSMEGSKLENLDHKVPDVL